MNYKFFFIIIIVCFFLIFAPKQQENFITWFLPFYNKGTKDLTRNTPPFVTSNLIYGQLKFDYIKNINFILLKNRQFIAPYYNFLLSNILKSSKVQNLDIKSYSNPENLLKKVDKTANQISIASAPLLVKTLSEDIEQMENINFIIVPNYRFLFFITTKTTQISRLADINGKKINIGAENSDENILGGDILENMQTIWNITTETTTFNNEDALKKLINGEIDGMFFTDLYPSYYLNKVIINDISKMIILVPIGDIKYSLFKQRHPYINQVSIDLTSLPKNYLPVKIKGLYFNKFRPDMNVYCYPDFMICNKKTAPKISYELVNAIVSNMDVINKSDFVLKNHYNYMAFPAIANNLFMPVHIGAKIFYNQITVNTTVPDAECKYYIGNAKCDKKRVEGAKIVINTN